MIQFLKCQWFLNEQFTTCFSLKFVFSVQLTLNKCSMKIAIDSNRTLVLGCGKWPLCHLVENKRPTEAQPLPQNGHCLPKFDLRDSNWNICCIVSQCHLMIWLQFDNSARINLWWIQSKWECTYFNFHKNILSRVIRNLY